MKRRLHERLHILWGGLFLWGILLLFQVTGIWAGDSGDLVTAAYLGGVPHPPGYPLYTFLGFLFSRIPLFTPSWRVGLLSSIPHAAVLVFVYIMVLELTKSKVASLFALLFLLSNYLFFLYSITPEVFALFDLFIIVLLYMAYRYKQTGRDTWAWAFAFVFGLSLTHHHVILFLVPAFFVWFSPNVRKLWKRMALFIVFGLLPYVYAPVAGMGNSIINWDRPVTPAGFIRLITRADYGTFVSSGFYGSDIWSRVLSLKTYVQFLWLDLTWAGLVLACVGLWWIFLHDKRLFKSLMLGLLCAGPLFFFYASFPLVNRFTLGTYERFLLPSYLLLSIAAGAGFAGGLSWAQRISARIGMRSIPFLLACVLFVYPVGTGVATVFKFWGVRTDRTADFLGVDVLAGVPPDALFFVSHDTPLFTSQYVRYALGSRSDVVLLHLGRMAHRDYPEVLWSVFGSDMVLPSPESLDPVKDMIDAELASGKRPIVSNTKVYAPEGFAWVPYGLVYVLTPAEGIPDSATLVSDNERLWSTFQNPDDGILGRYNHLMLADVRNVYTNARLELGKLLFRAGETRFALEQFEKAILYKGETQLSDAYMYAGMSYLALGKCEESLAAFSNAQKFAFITDPTIMYQTGRALLDCGDPDEAQRLFEQVESLRRGSQIPLDKAQ